MGERGLTAGRFYTIYNPDAAVPIDDDRLRERFERKRDADMEDIHSRMREVEIERAYRIVGSLEKTALDIEGRAVPALQAAMARWKKRVLWGDAMVFGLGLVMLLIWSINVGYWQGMAFAPPWLESLSANSMALYGSILAAVLVVLGLHFTIKTLAARSIGTSLARHGDNLGIRGNLARAFQRNTKPWRSIFSKVPVGWGRFSRKRLRQVIEDADSYVQTLNDRFTNPSGDDVPRETATDEREKEPGGTGA